MNEREILTAWALRFDGYRYCENTHWSNEDRLATTERLVRRLEMPQSQFQQLALFFMLQRHLEKWGGEMLGSSTFEWRAYRTLFLVTASYEVPERWQSEKWYNAWKCDLQPRTAECISFVANAHAAEGYGPAQCLGDIETEWNYYFQERYLFETVGPKFRLSGSLDAFDFFSIVIWKANRAKSRIAKRLQQRAAGASLEKLVADLAIALQTAVDRKARFMVLTDEYGFLLPMASAILSVLWPDQFSIYDVRVCEALPEFSKLVNVSDRAWLWSEYERYVEAVRNLVPGTMSLRDKDRVLWARSAMRQLYHDLQNGFARNSGLLPAS